MSITSVDGKVFSGESSCTPSTFLEIFKCKPWAWPVRQSYKLRNFIDVWGRGALEIVSMWSQGANDELDIE